MEGVLIQVETNSLGKGKGRGTLSKKEREIRRGKAWSCPAEEDLI